MLLRATSCAFGVLRWSITSMVASMVVSMPRRFCILKPRKGQFSMLVSYGRSLQPIGYSLRFHLLALTSKNIWKWPPMPRTTLSVILLTKSMAAFIGVLTTKAIRSIRASSSMPLALPFMVFRNMLVPRVIARHWTMPCNSLTA